jgi:nicotinamide-nucleotide amidase
MDLAQKIITVAGEKNVLLATAESCTGGMIAAALTDISGSSVAVDRGFITYSNAAKTELLDVDTDLISEFGAVSQQVAEAMAKGALHRISAHPLAIAVSVSGVAGPGGGSDEKPVGYVWFGIALRENDAFTIRSQSGQFSGDRHEVRKAAVMHALGMIDDMLQTLDIPTRL